jgi:hypothetical protein
MMMMMMKKQGDGEKECFGGIFYIAVSVWNGKNIDK